MMTQRRAEELYQNELAKYTEDNSMLTHAAKNERRWDYENALDFQEYLHYNANRRNTLVTYAPFLKVQGEYDVLSTRYLGFTL